MFRRRKPLEKVLEELAAEAAEGDSGTCTTDADAQLDKCLKLPDLVAYGVNNMVGAGIFVVIGSATKLTGSSVIISFFLAAVISAFSGLTFAEFAASIPTSGSGYSYLYVTIGELPAFCVAHLLSLSLCVGAGIGVRACSGYMFQLIDVIAGIKSADGASGAEPESLLKLNYLAPTLALILMMMQLRGARDSAFVNKCMAIMNIVLLLTFFVVGMWYSDFENNVFSAENSFTNGGKGVLSATGQVYYSFIGFDAVCLLAKESITPEKNIPRALFSSLFLVFLVYGGVALSLCGMVPVAEIDVNAPLSAAFMRHNVEWAFHLITFAAMTNTLATSFCGIMCQPRLWMEMSNDGLLYEKLGEIDLKTHIPYYGTITAGVLAALAAGLFEVDLLADICSCGMLLAYTLINIALIVGRYCGMQRSSLNSNTFSRRGSEATFERNVGSNSESDGVSNPESPHSTRTGGSKSDDSAKTGDLVNVSDVVVESFLNGESPSVPKVSNWTYNCVIFLSISALVLPFTINSKVLHEQLGSSDLFDDILYGIYNAFLGYKVSKIGEMVGSHNVDIMPFRVNVVTLILGISLVVSFVSLQFFDGNTPIWKQIVDCNKDRESRKIRVLPREESADAPISESTKLSTSRVQGQVVSPYFPFVAIIAVMSNLYVLNSLSIFAKQGLLMWLGGGILLYLAYGLTHSKVKRREQQQKGHFRVSGSLKEKLLV